MNPRLLQRETISSRVTLFSMREAIVRDRAFFVNVPLIPKERLHLIEEILLAGRITFGFELGKFLEQVLLFLGEADGSLDGDADEKIALALTVDIGGAFTFDSENFVRLGAFRDVDA